MPPPRGALLHRKGTLKSTAKVWQRSRNAAVRGGIERNGGASNL